MYNQNTNYYLKNAFVGIWRGEVMKDAYTPILECIEKDFCGKFFRCKEVAEKIGCSVSMVSHLISSLKNVEEIKIEKLIESQNIIVNDYMPIDDHGNPKYLFEQTQSGDYIKVLNSQFDWSRDWRWNRIPSWKTVEVVSYKITFAE